MSDTPGQKLRQARTARKLTIKQVVQATRIRSYYIEAMEADDFSILPSVAQAKGFLRSYAEFLGLKLEELTAEQAPEEAGKDSAPEAPPAEPPPPPPAPKPEPTPQPETVPSSPGIAVIERNDPAKELKTSDVIFQEIGGQLRQRRELLSLTLDEVERHTKVRRNNLHLIEQGDFEALASPVQSRGMLKAYADFLDLDAESILLRFAEGIQVRHTERQPAEKQSARRPRWAIPYWVKWFISPDLLFGGLIVLTTTLLVLWGANYFIQSSQQPLAGEGTKGPSISDVFLAASEVPAADATVQAQPTSIADVNSLGLELTDVTIPSETPLPSAPGAFLQITLIVRERTFVRVIVDGEVKENGRLAPGAALTFDGTTRIEVLTGNGAAVQVIYNQFNLGFMGNTGEVVNRIYTLEGVQTPTPTLTPTATNTPRNMRTPTPTPTLTPIGPDNP